MIFSIATRATIEVSDAAVLFPFPLQIGMGLVQIDTLEYKFALYSLYRVQICTLPYRSANLYFNTQECKFVLCHTGVQICTSPYKSANLHLGENKSITYNKFAFVYKFMPLSSADVHWALPATKLCCCFCCINSRSPSRSTGSHLLPGLSYRAFNW